MISKNINDTNKLIFKSVYNSNTGSNSARQSVKIFGSDNGRPIDGIFTLYGNGQCIWDGTGSVSAIMMSDGTVEVTLPINAYDIFTLISAQRIE